MVLPKKTGLKGSEGSSGCPETSPCWEMRGTHVPSEQGLELTGTAQAPPVGVNREQCRGSATCPPPSCKLSVKDLLFPFIRFLRLIISSALLQA